MQKMKKSKNKPRTQRSIEMEQERREIIQREEEKAAKKKSRSAAVVNSMLCMYSTALAIMSWLFDYMGIIATIALVMGIFGWRGLKEKKGRDYYAALIGMILAVLRIALTVFDLIRAL